MAAREPTVPLNDFQAGLARLLSSNRSPDNYLAGGSALHLEPNSLRLSNDLDFFQDSEARVASAFHLDETVLRDQGFKLEVELALPGYVRALVSRGPQATKVEWAHDSAWRFLPVIQDPRVGYRLHPVDLAINKLLALAGRDEPRDFLDVLYAHRTILPFGAQVWAAPGKDPGFSPGSLLELLRRRGKYHPQEFARLQLTKPVDLQALKQEWLGLLDHAGAFILSRPPEELGCLYFDRARSAFIEPAPGPLPASVSPHFGRPGGVLPSVG